MSEVQGSSVTNSLCLQVSGLFMTPCENWGLGTGVKNADSLANAIPLSNIRWHASDSGVSSSTAPMKLWQAQLASRVKTLDLQSSEQLCNASLCLPSLLIVLIPPPRVAELPRVCTAPGHVPIYQVLSGFCPRTMFPNAFS